LLDSWTGRCPDIIERNKPESAHDCVNYTGWNNRKNTVNKRF